MSETGLSTDPREIGNANLIYILYLVGIAVPIVGIVGLVMAYNARAGSGELLDNHYRNQINIFWKTAAFTLVGVVTLIFIIGGLILLGAVIWYIVRCVQGMQALARGQMISDPASWAFPPARYGDQDRLIS